MTTPSEPATPPGTAGTGRAADPGAPLDMSLVAEALDLLVIGAISEGVVVSTRSGGLRMANAAAERILGLSRAQLEFGELPPDGWQMFEEDGVTPIRAHPGGEVMRTGRPVHNRLAAVRHVDGSVHWVRMSGAPLHAPDGSPDGVVMTFVDITDERSRFQREIADARLRSLDERLNDIELIVALDGRLVHANDRAREAYGYTREELARLTVHDLRAPSSVLDVADQMHRADEGGARFETVHRRKDGSEFEVEVSSRGFTVAGVRYLHSLVRDLTGIRAAEAERQALIAQLDETRRDQELVLETSPLGICKARDRHLIWVNHRMEEQFGHEPGGMTGIETHAIYADESDWEEMGRTAYPILAGGLTYVGEHEFRRRDGSFFWGRLSGRAIHPERPFEESVWTVEDITGERESELRRAEADERLRSIITAMAEGVVLQDASGAIVMANEAALRTLGMTRDELEGRTSIDPRWEAIHEDGSPFPGTEHPSMVTLRTGHPQAGIVMGIRTTEGSLRWISISSEPLRRSPDQPPYAVVATFTDITDIRRGREALEASERRYRRLFENLREAVIVFDVVRNVQGRPVSWLLRDANAGGRRVLGPAYPFSVGRPAGELIGDAQLRPYVEATDLLVGAPGERGRGADRPFTIDVASGRFTARMFAVDTGTVVVVGADPAAPR